MGTLNGLTTILNRLFIPGVISGYKLVKRVDLIVDL